MLAQALDAVREHRRSMLKLALAAAFAVYVADAKHVYTYIAHKYDYLDDDDDEDEDEDEDVAKLLDSDLRKISADDFKQSLAELDACLVPGYGLFAGPDDPALKIFREAAVGFGGTRAVAMQLAHSFIAKGVLVHSNVFTDPFDRAEKTQRYTVGMLYGTKEEIVSSARAVRSLHGKVSGEMGPGSSAFPPETRFDAAAVHALVRSIAFFCTRALTARTCSAGWRPPCQRAVRTAPSCCAASSARRKRTPWWK